jgi:V/A-type H+-transporting ATPase subunit K
LQKQKNLGGRKMFYGIVGLLVVLSAVIPYGIHTFRGKKNGKTLIFANIASFFLVVLGATIFMFTGGASAAGTATAAGSTIDSFSTGMGFLAAALSTGFACVGGGIGVAGAASAAIGAISENEGMFGRALIFVALAEGFAIYGLLVSFTILGRLG